MHVHRHTHICLGAHTQSQPLQSWVGVGPHRNECWISEPCCHGTKTRICLHYLVWLDLSESSLSISLTYTSLTDVHSCIHMYTCACFFLSFFNFPDWCTKHLQFKTQFAYQRLAFQCTSSAKQMQTCKPLHTLIHNKRPLMTDPAGKCWVNPQSGEILMHTQPRGLPSHPLIHQPILMHIHSS